MTTQKLSILLILLMAQAGCSQNFQAAKGTSQSSTGQQQQSPPPQQTAIAGECGSANGMSHINAPTANLCLIGSASAVTGTGPFAWMCAGLNGGANASCSAQKTPPTPTPVAGQCGTANGMMFPAAPTANLCLAGNASAVTGTGPFTWMCAGLNGGANASCSAQKTAMPMNGQCGSANGTTVAVAPTTNLCLAGMASAVTGAGPFNWTCAGVNGGANASCSAQKMATPGPVGGAGCGLTNAAFCENFDQGPAAIRGRAGDLDATKWTAGRLVPEMSVPGVANPVRLADIPPCKASFPMTRVFPPFDTMICDPDARGNRRLMTAVVMQNYGINAYMIQQPFDFAGRTGKITFDVDAHTDGGLGAFMSLDITEEPYQAPTFQEYSNMESGPIPKNAIMMNWKHSCNTVRTASKLSNVITYNNYVMNLIQNPTFEIGVDQCSKTKKGSLNRIEIFLSQTKVEVYMTDFSNDGVTFTNRKLIYSTSINLPFTRGFIHLTARNHAGEKYIKDFHTERTGVFHWDNVGFDGPIISGHRFYNVPDNTTETTFYGGEPVKNLGYILRDGTNTPAAGIHDPDRLISNLQIPNVNTAGATRARLTMNAYLPIHHTVTETWGIRYRLNGKSWNLRTLTPVEIRVINNNYVNPSPGSAGNILLIMDVPFADLQNGTNTLEFMPVNIPMDYAPALANIDLVLSN